MGEWSSFPPFLYQNSTIMCQTDPFGTSFAFFTSYFIYLKFCLIIPQLNDKFRYKETHTWLNTQVLVLSEFQKQFKAAQTEIPLPNQSGQNLFLGP